MTINVNSKTSLVIAAAAAGSGAIIFGATKLIGVLKNKKDSKEPEAESKEEKSADEKSEK